MIGTFINVGAIIIGGGLGLLLGAQVPERLNKMVVNVLGLFCIALGVSLFLETQQPLYVLGGLLIGAGLGEWWRVEDRVQGLGAKLQARFVRDDDDDGRFVRGFLTASLIYCIGPIAILGSIQDGLTGDYSLLVIKAVMDGFISMALASTLGVGVLFSSLMILLYQGSLTLLAVQAQAILTDVMIAEMTAAGGVLLMGLGIGSLLEIKPIRTGDLLPALIVTPALVWVVALLPF